HRSRRRSRRRSLRRSCTTGRPTSATRHGLPSGSQEPPTPCSRAPCASRRSALCASTTSASRASTARARLRTAAPSRTSCMCLASAAAWSPPRTERHKGARCSGSLSAQSAAPAWASWTRMAHTTCLRSSPAP
ncbi:hypothetical protein H4R21_006358, partial [Coemansia helicoidea]